MRADPFAHRDSDAPPFHSEPINHNQPLNQAHVFSDLPLDRLTIETRTPEAEAMDRGARIMRRHRGHHTWDALSESTKHKVSAKLLMYSFCYDYGQIEEWTAGLVVRDSIKVVALDQQLSPTSAYRVTQKLEKAGIVRRILGHGNRHDAYEIVMPEPLPGESPQEDRARANCNTAAQGARANSRALQLSSASNNPKYLTEHEIARANSRALQLSSASEAAGPPFSDGKTGALHLARALCPPSTINTTANLVVGAGEDAAAEVEQVTEELTAIGIFPNVIPQLAKKTDLWLALAVRFEVEGKRTPGKLANWILTQPDPETRINPPARAKADREIQKRRGITAQPPTEADTTRAQQQAIEQRVTELIRTHPTLLATARQRAAELAVLGSSRENILTTSEPQKNPLIRSVVKEMIAHEFAPAAPSA